MSVSADGARRRPASRFHNISFVSKASSGVKACASCISVSASSALVRPLVWLFIFAAGFRQVLGISIIPPYETYILYEVYITPGLLAMIQLFNGHQRPHSRWSMTARWATCARSWSARSLSLVPALVEAARRTFLVDPAGLRLSCRRLFLGNRATAYRVSDRPSGVILSGLMFGSLGMLLSSIIRQLENFAGVMNFVIFPMFSGSLGFILCGA